MAPGDYPLRLSILDSDRAVQPVSIELGVVSVQPVERSFVVPSPPHASRADFGGKIELLGYSLSAEAAAPGDRLTVTLFWRAQAEMEDNYTVFVHLVGPDGRLSAQHDGQPVGGTYPTSLWLSEEVVTDVHEMTLRVDAPAGDHWVEVGMYVAETGARLVNSLTGSDSARLQTIRVEAP
jgi:hypothetical protein